MLRKRLKDIYGVYASMHITMDSVYGKKSILSKESDTLRSYRVYISPTMQASSALIQIESELLSVCRLPPPQLCAVLKEKRPV